MEDRQIVELFWKRDESAIAETECKYGAFCLKTAANLLSDGEDAKECVNEAFFELWNQIPPQRPEKLGPWLGRIVRNISIKRWHKDHAQKRYSGIEQMLSELDDSIPSGESVEREIEDAELGKAIDRWLLSLPLKDRNLFVRRYWYGTALKELAGEQKLSPEKLARKMYRLRLSLKSFLEKEELFYGKA